MIQSFENIFTNILPWSQRFSMIFLFSWFFSLWESCEPAVRKKNLWLPRTWISLSCKCHGQDLTVRLRLVDWFVWLAVQRGWWGYLSLHFFEVNSASVSTRESSQFLVHTCSRFACFWHGLCFCQCRWWNFDLRTWGVFSRDWKSH